jgi:hypothetical protein
MNYDTGQLDSLPFPFLSIPLYYSESFDTHPVVEGMFLSKVTKLG